MKEKGTLFLIVVSFLFWNVVGCRGRMRHQNVGLAAEEISGEMIAKGEKASVREKERKETDSERDHIGN